MRTEISKIWLENEEAAEKKLEYISVESLIDKVSDFEEELKLFGEKIEELRKGIKKANTETLVSINFELPRLLTVAHKLKKITPQIDYAIKDMVEGVDKIGEILNQ